mmetsp:Transcript_16061/g.64873  ORF Transcript_16061/g.64873 Transcript_16061/m.64873 type:complete len:457 (-) Transcript_16061:876-2246(-)
MRGVWTIGRCTVFLDGCFPRGEILLMTGTCDGDTKLGISRTPSSRVARRGPERPVDVAEHAAMMRVMLLGGHRRRRQGGGGGEPTHGDDVVVIVCRRIIDVDEEVPVRCHVSSHGARRAWPLVGGGRRRRYARRRAPAREPAGDVVVVVVVVQRAARGVSAALEAPPPDCRSKSKVRTPRRRTFRRGAVLVAPFPKRKASKSGRSRASMAAAEATAAVSGAVRVTTLKSSVLILSAHLVGRPAGCATSLEATRAASSLSLARSSVASAVAPNVRSLPTEIDAGSAVVVCGPDVEADSPKANVVPASSVSSPEATPSATLSRKARALGVSKHWYTGTRFSRRSPHVVMPSPCSSLVSSTRPTPGTLRHGRSLRKARISAREPPTLNCPSGLRWSAAILASRNVGPSPPDNVSPPVAADTRRRSSASVSSAAAANCDSTESSFSAFSDADDRRSRSST